MSNTILHRALCLFEEPVKHNRLYLVDALYLCVFLEQFILHDQLVIAESPNFDEKLLFENNVYDFDHEHSLETRLRANPALSPLMKGQSILFSIPNIEDTFDAMYEVDSELVEAGFDSGRFYEAENIIEMRSAIAANRSYIPDQSVYALTAMEFLDQTNQHAASLLARAYSQVSGWCREDLDRLARVGSPRNLFVPPIAALVLSRIGVRKQIADAALELRDAFSETRMHFSSYEMRIRDDSLPIGESLAALDELEASLRSLAPPEPDSTITSLAEWRDLGDLSKILDGMDATESGSVVKAALGMPLKVGVKKLKQRRARYLSRLRHDFLQLSNYGRLLDRTFGEPVTSSHIKTLQSEPIAAGFASSLLKAGQPGSRADGNRKKRGSRRSH